jgi:hypothetical protein
MDLIASKDKNSNWYEMIADLLIYSLAGVR